MRTIQVMPKEIHVVMEFSLEEIIMMKKGLEATTLNLNMDNDADAAVSTFMTDALYAHLEQLIKEISGD